MPESLQTALAQSMARLRNQRNVSLAVILLAFILIRIPDLPGWLTYIQFNGVTSIKLMNVLVELFASLVSITVFITIFGLGVRNASEVVGNPWRFLMILLFAATVASACGREVNVLLSHIQQFWDSDMRSMASLFEIWMRHVLGGALFGWLYFLYRQRSEDAVQFASVLTRRSILARQIAQSRLVTTRAQIDPELVTRVLHRVHQLQQLEPDQALALLNNMIAYLRLAMNRLRESSSSFSAELALCNSYIALQQAQTGVNITLHATVDARTRGIPVFLIARQLLNIALRAGATEIAMRIAIQSEQVEISAETAATTLNLESQALLNMQLEEFALNRKIRFQHSVDSDRNCYAIQIPWY